MGLEGAGQIVGLQVLQLVDLGGLAVAAALQRGVAGDHQEARAQQRQEGIGEGAVDRLMTAEACGDPAAGHSRHGQDHQAVLSRQGGQGKQDGARRDGCEPPPPMRPDLGRCQQRGEAGEGRGGEQHVLPDDPRIDQAVGDHGPEREQRGDDPGGSGRGADQDGQGAIEQKGVEDDEQGRAAHDCVA